MEKKIAVHCKTEEEWNATKQSFGHTVRIGSWIAVTKNYPNENLCIKSDQACFDSRVTCIRKGYLIISAADYLKEGEVEEFEEFEGLEVPALMDGFKEGVVDKILKGTTFRDCCNIGRTVKCPTSCNKCLLYLSNSSALKRYMEGNKSTKPKTTKENNMKENNTDSNVLAVFGDKVKGNELVIIDRHFDKDMLQRIVMEKHHKDIQTACGEAETKRLKEEAKKDK